MSKCYLEYKNCSNWDECGCSCKPHPRPQCPPMPPCCRGPRGKSAYEIALYHGFVGTEAAWLASLKGESGPFLSSYIEAVGSTQTVNSQGNVIFDITPEEIDIVGRDIRIDSTGTTFTITRAGLYRVEWSMNLASGTTPVLVGLMEKGEPASGLSHSNGTGNHSSGALINVTASDLPYTVSLHNFGGAISIANPATAQNTAVSIRISRFADAPN